MFKKQIYIFISVILFVFLAGCAISALPEGGGDTGSDQGSSSNSSGDDASSTEGPSLGGDSTSGDDPSSGDEPAVVSNRLPILIPGYTKPRPEGGLIFINYFNSIATDEDYILFTENSLLRDKIVHLFAMSEVQNGQVVQSFASWQVAKAELEKDRESGGEMLAMLDCIYYDLEQWEKSLDEWMDIEASSIKMGEVAEEFGLCYLGGLSGKLEAKNPNTADASGGLEQMATQTEGYLAHWFGYPDRYGIGPYESYLFEQAERIRAASPDTKILVGISVEKKQTVDEMISMLKNTESIADVYTLFSKNNAESLNRVIAVISGLGE